VSWRTANERRRAGVGMIGVDEGLRGFVVLLCIFIHVY